MTIVARLMILFGFAEVVTGFTHDFFGVTTSAGMTSTVAGAAIGLFYLVSGLLILTKRRGAVGVAIVLLALDVVGRIAMVVTGLYPVNSVPQTVAIVFGTALAAGFAIYVGSQWKFLG